jgi:3-hydroxymyristoyl/3-hydroxydecanoyl-(acyl carrier protein) dehydratase
MPESPADAVFLKDSIQDIIPHRYPFLLIDRVTEFNPGTKIRGIKNFTTTERFVHGFQPENLMVPCSILLEMVTQLGAILVLERPGMAGKIAVILQIPSAMMHHVVMAGEAVEAQAEVLKLRESFGELRGTVYRGSEVVAEGQMRFAIAAAEGILPSGV